VIGWLIGIGVLALMFLWVVMMAAFKAGSNADRRISQMYWEQVASRPSWGIHERPEKGGN
jgi:hypothetical protein